MSENKKIKKIKVQDVSYDIGGDSSIELTKAEYDALTTKDPDTIYLITDWNEASQSEAQNVYYDKSTSGLSSQNVQKAIDELTEMVLSIKSLTQDQYDALSDTEKNDDTIIYLIQEE